MAAGDGSARRVSLLFLPLLASIVMCALLSGAWLSVLAGEPAAFLPGLLLGSLFAVPHACLLGVPYACWLRRIGRFNIGYMAAGGLAIGTVPMGFLLDSLLCLWTGLIGMSSALAFLATSRWLDR